MTEYDLLFWVCIVFVGTLAYAIESGVANKDRRVVFNAMLSVTVTALYVMFLVEDTTSFDFVKPVPVKQEEGSAQGGDMALGTEKATSAAAKSPKAQKQEPAAPKGIFTDCDVCPSMIMVVAGSYTLGSPETEKGRTDFEAERPIQIAKDFAISRFEIMRGEFAAFVKEEGYKPAPACLVGGRRSSGHTWLNPGFEQDDKHPVVCVSWTDAKAYVAWLTKKTKKRYRLLSESEWEWAARAGSQHAYSVGQVIAPTHGNFNRTREGTAPTGFFSANKAGVFDVHGNVWEFVEDCWSPDTSFLPADGRPLGILGNCNYRVIRGGAWDSPPSQVRSAVRAYVGSAAASNTIGFRVARSNEPLAD